MGPSGFEFVREKRLVGGGCEQGLFVVLRHERLVCLWSVAASVLGLA